MIEFSRGGQVLRSQERSVSPIGRLPKNRLKSGFREDSDIGVMGSVQFSLFFKQAPVFRWGGRMSHPPGWAGGKSDSHRPCSGQGDCRLLRHGFTETRLASSRHAVAPLGKGGVAFVVSGSRAPLFYKQYVWNILSCRIINVVIDE